MDVLDFLHQVVVGFFSHKLSVPFSEFVFNDLLHDLQHLGQLVLVEGGSQGLPLLGPSLCACFKQGAVPNQVFHGVLHHGIFVVGGIVRDVDILQQFWLHHEQVGLVQGHNAHDRRRFLRLRSDAELVQDHLHQDDLAAVVVLVLEVLEEVDHGAEDGRAGSEEGDVLGGELPLVDVELGWPEDEEVEEEESDQKLREEQKIRDN